ncbi:hypothetical protein ANCDUO_20393, partial [Ancylostoma duodenale]
VIVPISLYITVEIIKAAQIYFLSQDIELYDEESDRPIDCRSLNIPEELGQITHVLSDKTGTLTENIMVFRNCAFDLKDYGSEKDLVILQFQHVSVYFWCSFVVFAAERSAPD